MKRSCAVVALVGASLSLVAFAGCMNYELDEDSVSSVEQTWLCQYVRGHEDLVRLAYEEAAEILPASERGWAQAIEFNFPPPTPGEMCSNSSNPLLLGNCGTDFPDERLLSFYETDKDHWHESPRLDLHSVRNSEYWGGSWQFLSARRSCYDIRYRLQVVTEHGLELWNQGRIDDAYYFWGHATHILQDSFSPAHSQRVGGDLRSLSDICTADYQVDGICFHPFVSLGDAVWTAEVAEENPDCANDAYGAPTFECVVPEARAAVRATVGYLRVVSQLLNDPELSASQVLGDFFESNYDDAVGYLRCDQLSDEYVQYERDEKGDVSGDPVQEPEPAAGCSVASSSSGNGGALATFGLLAVAVVVGRRRRRS